MKNKNFLFSTGEFAKLNGINKRTLHYYNDIGLFCPQVIDENGYHYYSSLQTIQLEMILLLKKLGLSIEDIKSYMNQPSAEVFMQLLTEKKELIDQSIAKLLEAKVFLQKKLDKLELGMSAEHGKIEHVYLQEKRLLLSDPITGTYDEQDFAVATEFSLRLKKLFGMYDNFGSRIATEHILKHEYEQYDAFFAYQSKIEEDYDAVRPEGEYLRSYCIGGWEKLKDVYQRILEYAKENHLKLKGYAYEEGLNEMSLQQDGDYVTMITVAFEKNEGEFS